VISDAHDIIFGKKNSTKDDLPSPPSQPNMASPLAQDDVQVSLISDPKDLAGAFHTQYASFGVQTHDSIWLTINPRWDTPEGVAEGVGRLTARFNSITRNNAGEPNTLFVKATIDGQIAGFAIWQQASFVEGYGDPPTDDLGGKEEIEKLHPGNETEQRFTSQIFASLMKRRISYVHEKEKASPPATFVLDICSVDPKYQRRGIASKLVQFGLDEAKKRGLEATTEASVMGRSVYEKLGFWGQGMVGFEMDEEFKGRDKPPNVFMRTGGPPE
jgi:GNAT superfamily N-acetyltransferase